MTSTQRIAEDLRVANARLEAVSGAPADEAAPTLRAIASLLRGCAADLVDIADSASCAVRATVRHGLHATK